MVSSLSQAHHVALGRGSLLYLPGYPPHFTGLRMKTCIEELTSLWLKRSEEEYFEKVNNLALNPSPSPCPYPAREGYLPERVLAESVRTVRKQRSAKLKDMYT